ncbi:hypothetical protein LMH87_003442 [Akanthomyces muscarius]|uniref:Uncharacterized protein n=1 Tax=Akanthomyces muscarius TaxID=2231603 RepID=A0A9W8Q1F5_AKAMU|nr:hypothetical protein LMH87_003442 [Akanthomyces muscarius]KAJ4144561.1 hypothetical protein LMH87_003442 [Akanthomyces muscarius]
MIGEASFNLLDHSCLCALCRLSWLIFSVFGCIIDKLASIPLALKYTQTCIKLGSECKFTWRWIVDRGGSIRTTTPASPKYNLELASRHLTIRSVLINKFGRAQSTQIS